MKKIKVVVDEEGNWKVKKYLRETLKKRICDEAFDALWEKKRNWHVFNKEKTLTKTGKGVDSNARRGKQRELR